MAKIIDKKRILKAARKCHIQGNPIRLSADILAETFKARRQWHSIFKMMKEKNLTTRIFYPAGLSFRLERDINHFAD